MGAELHGDWRMAARAALDWWVDAGVDVLVEDAPRDWLATPPRTTATAAEPARAVPGPAVLIDFPDLGALVAWRKGSDAPEAAWPVPRIGPTGPADAPLVVVTDMAEPDDGADGVLTGQAGRLLDRMLAAIGADRADTHVVPLAWGCPPTGQIGDNAAQLARLLDRYLAFLPARRALLLGQATSRALLGADAARARGRLHAINHPDRMISAVATFHPRFLLERPAAKAEAWKDLQRMIGTGEA